MLNKWEDSDQTIASFNKIFNLSPISGDLDSVVTIGSVQTGGFREVTVENQTLFIELKSSSDSAIFSEDNSRFEKIQLTECEKRVVDVLYSSPVPLCITDIISLTKIDSSYCRKICKSLTDKTICVTSKSSRKLIYTLRSGIYNHVEVKKINKINPPELPSKPVVNRINKVSSELLKGSKLTKSLKVIETHGPIYREDLIEIVGISIRTSSNIIRELLNQGLIQKSILDRKLVLNKVT